MELWNYRAAFTRVVDGDTFVLFCDRGQHQYGLEMYRLADIDTWERRRPTLEQGQAAAACTLAWFLEKQALWRGPTTLIVHGVEVAWPFHIHTELDDAFGRYLTVVQAQADGELLSDALRAAGHEKVLVAAGGAVQA